MQARNICKVIGILLMVFSFTMLTPLAVEYIYHDGANLPFVLSFNLCFCSGLFLWCIFQSGHIELKARDGFLVVVLFWTILSAFACLPFLFCKSLSLSFTDALFESISGFTTTGASILENVEALPHSLLYYRQQLHFVGGMGIVILAIAILPMLGIGGMQLFRVESTGPIKDSKLTPRITQTAKTLWLLYCGLNGCCALLFWLSGMSAFDAIGEAFSTVSTGGFSTHTNSIAAYHSKLIEFISLVFMLLGGTNFSLHFIALQKFSIKHYWQDVEFRTYMLIWIGGSVLVAITLLLHRVYLSASEAFLQSFYTFASLMTTSGYTSSDFNSWPTFVPILIMLIAMIGGCAGSTSGGLKIIRFLLICKQISREEKRLIHPNIVVPIKFGDALLPEPILQSMWAFISAFIATLVVLFILLLATGLDFTSAFGAISAALSNTGIGIGLVAKSFAKLNDEAKWILMVAMLAGRLEVFPLLILFLPSYWEK